MTMTTTTKPYVIDRRLHQIFSVRPGDLIRVKPVGRAFTNGVMMRRHEGLSGADIIAGRSWVKFGPGVMFCVLFVESYDHLYYFPITDLRANSGNGEAQPKFASPDGKIFEIHCVGVNDGFKYKRKVFLNEGLTNMDAFQKIYDLPNDGSKGAYSIELSFEDMFDLVKL